MPKDQPEKSAVTEIHAAAHDPALAEIRFYTVAEVAEVMRVSRMTVYRLVHSGELPAVRVGRSFRVPERTVHNYLRAAFTDAG
ncbi:MAG: helix-turn-helix domain-containing protein [Nakamurella sp.]